MLDAVAFVREVLSLMEEPDRPLPMGIVRLNTDAGPVTIESRDRAVLAYEGAGQAAETVTWPSSALAQLVTGYFSVETLCATLNTPLSRASTALLGALFPRRWRFSKNGSWFFKS